MLIPCFANALLSLLSPVYGFIFSVSEAGVYRRGGLFAVFVAAYLWGMLVLLKTILDMGKRYRYRFRFKLYAVFGFILAGTSLQIALPGVHTSWTCITLALALHYGFVCEMSDTLDALTKLYNRKSYESEIERLKDRRFAVVVLDVDDFKRVNDRYGHPYGDECLATLASLVHESFYRIGDCYRIGGDEFCVLCRSTDEEKITSAIAKLVRGIEDCRARDPRLPVISYGYQISDGARDETILAADRQMYQNKARHKAERKNEDAS
jgi:diguanylate cyclase (GGDEF)-like protein